MIMKKFYMILAALLIGSVCFAQFAIKAGTPSTAADRSGYVGNLSFDGTLFPMPNGGEYAIAPKQINSTLTGTITKVKFYHTVYGTQYANNSYTIKIYNNINLSGPGASQGYYDGSSCGEASYTQDYTATEEGWQEVELGTSYNVPSGDFWISIQVNGSGLACFGGAASAVAGQYYMTNSGYWMAPNLTTQQGGTPTLYSAALAVYVDDGGAEEIISDFEAKMYDAAIVGNQIQLGLAPEQYTIGTNADLVIYPFYQNNGPSPATTGTLTATIKLGGSTYGTPMTRTFTAENPCALSTMPESFYQSTGYAVTITAAEMNAMGLGNSFNVCYEVSYEGGNDNVSANNTFCIPVVRTDAQSDIQAKFYTDANGTTEVASSLTLSLDEDFNIYPAIKNNGPDAANGTVNVSIMLNSTPAAQQNFNYASQPIENGAFRLIDEEGFGFTAEEMDQYQITSFELCIVLSYSGNDPNEENNTVCVTVTRQTVAVEENLAEEISVYPNPANDMFTVANAEGATIVVVNSLGQVVASIENAASNQTIDASNFANGTYFVKVNENVIKINVVK